MKKEIGNFIKANREVKGWSQELLADKIYCARTKINKIENGNQYPNIDDLISLSEALEVSIEEIISGEKKTNKNQGKLNNNLIEFLITNNSKFKKAKILFIISFILFIFMTMLYFFQNYNSIRAYKVYGESEKHSITNGLLMLSKEKIYFDLGTVTPPVDELEILCEKDNELISVYKGSPDNILNDGYGYNSIINYEKFIVGNQNLYIKIGNEQIKLNFIEDFKNDNFWYKTIDNIGKEYENIPNVKIPEKIEKNFVCSNNFCILNNENETITYSNNILVVTRKETNTIYDISSKVFTYEENIGMDNEVRFTLENENLFCLSGNCSKAKKIFSNFIDDYINKYLN